jgi:hypothetical protein
MRIFGFIEINFISGRAVCCLKTKYRDERRAERAIAKQASLGRVRYSYKCPYCKYWHLTKMEQK